MVLDVSNGTKSPTCKENKSPPGRILYCRKCECHGQQVVLKGHAPTCPYELCTCNACEKLMSKRMRSFEKRNGDLIKSAFNARNKISRDGERKESMGEAEEQKESSPKLIVDRKPMTVMSYEIWKAKIAAEKREREERRKCDAGIAHSSSLSPCNTSIPLIYPSSSNVIRKRTYPFVNPQDTEESSHTAGESSGTFVNLPTIPPVRVMVHPESKQFIPSRPPTSSPHISTSRDSACASYALHSATSSDVPTSSSSSAATTSLQKELNAIPPAISSNLTIADVLMNVPNSVLLQQCLINHNRMQQGLPAVPIQPILPLTSNPSTSFETLAPRTSSTVSSPSTLLLHNPSVFLQSQPQPQLASFGIAKAPDASLLTNDVFQLLKFSQNLFR